MQVVRRERDYALNPRLLSESFDESDDCGFDDFDAGFEDEQGRWWPWEYVEKMTGRGVLQMRFERSNESNLETSLNRKVREENFMHRINAFLEKISKVAIVNPSISERIEIEDEDRTVDDFHDYPISSDDESLEDVEEFSSRRYGTKLCFFNFGDHLIDSTLRLVLGHVKSNGATSCDDFADFAFNLSLIMTHDTPEVSKFLPSFAFVADHCASVGDWRTTKNAYLALLFVARYRRFVNTNCNELVDDDTNDRGFSVFLTAKFGYITALLTYSELDKIFSCAYRGSLTVDWQIAIAHLRALSYRFFVTREEPSAREAMISFRKHLSDGNITVAVFYARFAGRMNVLNILRYSDCAERVRGDCWLDVCDETSLALAHMAVSMNLHDELHVFLRMDDRIHDYKVSHNIAVASTVQHYTTDETNLGLMSLQQCALSQLILAPGGSACVKLPYSRMTSSFKDVAISEIDASLRHLCQYDRNRWRRFVVWFVPSYRTITECGVRGDGGDVSAEDE